MTTVCGIDYRAFARLLERNGHGDAALAFRELLAHVEERDQRIDELERYVAALGAEVLASDAMECDVALDGQSPCGYCVACDPAAHDPELHA